MQTAHTWLVLGVLAPPVLGWEALATAGPRAQAGVPLTSLLAALGPPHSRRPSGSRSHRTTRGLSAQLDCSLSHRGTSGSGDSSVSRGISDAFRAIARERSRDVGLVRRPPRALARPRSRPDPSSTDTPRFSAAALQNRG